MLVAGVGAGARVGTGWNCVTSLHKKHLREIQNIWPVLSIVKSSTFREMGVANFDQI